MTDDDKTLDAPPNSIFGQEDQWFLIHAERTRQAQEEVNRLSRERSDLVAQIKSSDAKSSTALERAETAEAELASTKAEKSYVDTEARGLREHRVRIAEAAKAVDELADQLGEVAKLIVRLSAV
jgi:predicted RNase H-like nuclease (RuvC/YqgF family)